MLAFDSWIDSSVWGSGHSASGGYERFALFMERFHVIGLRRIGVEAGCEFFTLSIAGGLVLLALAIPAFELTSDDWLKKQDLAVVFQDRYGQEVGRRGIRHDDAVPFDELPPNLIHALISTEDRRFFDHYGIDVIGTMRALLVNSRSDTVRQGGSSLTQQLAKNLFLSNERTLPRKVNEAFLALWLEAHLTKREILSLYLDRAYLGGGTFGVQAASEFYFGKSVRDLSLPEAAMIAGLFKAPTKYAPHINLPAARARANDVLNNMVEAGYLTAGQIYAAQRNPATPVDRQQETSPDWYLDWAYNEVRDLAAAGKFGDETVLTVRTGLDPALQQHVEDTIESYLRQYGQNDNVRQAAAVILDPDGNVRAIVGGRDYGVSQFNRATEALRQPGSSFKPYVYLTALMTGRFKPSSIISGASLCLGKDYCPHNYDNETAGRITLSSALAMSLNTAAIRLSIEIGDGTTAGTKAKDGRAKVVATARRMGITTPLPDTVSLPLGADADKVIEHAGAYAAFAAGGGWGAGEGAAAGDGGVPVVAHVRTAGRVVADDDDGERDVEARAARSQAEPFDRHGEQRVACHQRGGAHDHRMSRAEQPVADPAAERRRGVEQGAERAPEQIGLRIGKAEMLHQEQQQDRLHAVIAEALPQLDQQHDGERLAARDGRRRCDDLPVGVQACRSSIVGPHCRDRACVLASRRTRRAAAPLHRSPAPARMRPPLPRSEGPHVRRRPFRRHHHRQRAGRRLGCA